MIKDSPNPPLESTSFHKSAHRAIKHYLNPPQSPAPNTEGSWLFAVRKGLKIETLLINVSEDLTSIQALASHLAFEVDGAPRSVALGICRILEGTQLLMNDAVIQCEASVRE
ncbi:hypothetical protein [Pseudomonas sp. KBW05]|uniref:DUF6124 family protein n=1 Tax=Pseudomonas sp. KBW05 TaxID=2153360 RepID=UPI000F5AD420|nr:hypothetical protein [Pseudomonas sp. KBW05]RQO46756.1 hypothetical protein DBR46_26950 [Pseudomonas sp. KBW05]